MFHSILAFHIATVFRGYSLGNSEFGKDSTRRNVPHIQQNFQKQNSYVLFIFLDEEQFN